MISVPGVAAMISVALPGLARGRCPVVVVTVLGHGRMIVRSRSRSGVPAAVGGNMGVVVLAHQSLLRCVALRSKCLDRAVSQGVPGLVDGCLHLCRVKRAGAVNGDAGCPAGVQFNEVDKAPFIEATAGIVEAWRGKYPEMVDAINRSLDEGGMNGLGMAVDDCRATFEELSAKGVVFLQEPADRPYGVEAVCRDNSGNWMVLVEPREYTPEDFGDGGTA